MSIQISLNSRIELKKKKGMVFNSASLKSIFVYVDKCTTPCLALLMVCEYSVCELASAAPSIAPLSL